MSGADDLLVAIEDIIRDDDYTTAGKAETILVLFADPVRRLAILNLIGDVKHALPGTTEEFYVVRPRGEATDA